MQCSHCSDCSLRTIAQTCVASTRRHTSTTANRCYASPGSPTHIGDPLARHGSNFESSGIDRELPLFSSAALFTAKWTCAKTLLKFEMQRPGHFMSRCGASWGFMHRVGQCTPEVPPCSVQHPQYFFLQPCRFAVSFPTFSVQNR